MSALTTYLRSERRIVGADSESIVERWTWGRRLLLDDDFMSPTGLSLKHGAADRLIRAASQAGLTLTQDEIQRRLRARAYPKRSQIGAAHTNLGTWEALARAGFPSVAADPDEPDFDPRSMADRVATNDRRGARLLAAAGATDAQLELWPEDHFDETSTLEELGKWLTEQDEITDRFLDLGRRRRDHYRELVDAVSGDLNATLQDAYDALGVAS